MKIYGKDEKDEKDENMKKRKTMRGGYQARKDTLYGQCKPKLRYFVRRLHKVNRIVAPVRRWLRGFVSY